MNTGLGEIQTHCELFSAKNILEKRKRKRGEEKKKEEGKRDREKRFKVTGHSLESDVELLFCPLLLFTVNNRRRK